MILVLGFFAVLFGAVLILELEELFAQLQSRLRMGLAALATSKSRSTPPQTKFVVKAMPEQEAQTVYPAQKLRDEARSAGVDENLSEHQSIGREDSSSAESQYESGTDSEDEPTDEMMHFANMVTAPHAFSFPRVGISVRVRPPLIDDLEDFRGRKFGRARPRGRGSEQPQRDLLRVHEGYMFIEDRLLRFKTSGGRDKVYEAWQDSKWRQAKRQEIWVQNGDEEAQCVALICVLDSSGCWTPLRIRESGWVECT